MKKIFSLAVGLLTAVGMFAQTETDALRMSRVNPFDGGSARYMGLSGAMGAFGGDYSAVMQNPATLAFFRRSQLSVTMGGTFKDIRTNWYGNKHSEKGESFNFDNISYVYSVPFSDGSGVTFGFSTHKRASFDRRYKMNVGNGLDFSLADFVSAQIPSDWSSDKFNDKTGFSESPWLSVLGYQAYWIYHPGEGTDKPGPWLNSFSYARPGEPLALVKPMGAALAVQESGYARDFDITMGVRDPSNIFYFGSSLVVSLLDYHLRTAYAEDFPDGDLLAKNESGNVAIGDMLSLENDLHTVGTGISLSLGAVFRPADSFRFGIAYHTPTWYILEDDIWARAASRYSMPLLEKDPKTGKMVNKNPEKDWSHSFSTPADASPYRYRFKTPHRLTLSSACVFGKKLMVDVDYGLSFGRTMRYAPDLNGDMNYEYDNSIMKEDFAVQHTLRIGAEVNITNRFALRSGGFYRTSYIKDKQLLDYRKTPAVAISVSGTIPHYELPKFTCGITGGVGYKFTPNLYGDAAIAYTHYQGVAQSFPKKVTPDGLDVMPADAPAKLIEENVQISFTLGYKF